MGWIGLSFSSVNGVTRYGVRGVITGGDEAFREEVDDRVCHDAVSERMSLWRLYDCRSCCWSIRDEDSVTITTGEDSVGVGERR